MYKINRMKTFILAAWLIILAITVIFILYTQRLIHTPMQHLLGAFNRVKKEISRSILRKKITVNLPIFMKVLMRWKTGYRI